MRLDAATGKVVRKRWIKFVIKDGIVLDAEKLRQEVKAMVATEKERRHIAPGPMPIENE